MAETQRIVAMLFSDIKGYSKITNDDLSVKIDKFNDEFKQQYLNTSNHIYCNTWGDAFFICSDDPNDLAEIALNLRDKFRNANWQRLGFSTSLEVRIGVHVEKARVLTENGVVKNVIGRNVSSTARIEPVVDPNQVFCSDTFHKHLSNDPQTNIKAIPLGKKQLAKNFGEMELYKLLRNYEAEATNKPSEAKAIVNAIPSVRIKKDFSDKELSDFLRASFNTIARYFEQALQQLQQQDGDIETEYEAQGSSKFTCTIFIKGKQRAQCRIWIGDGFSRNSILYSDSGRFSDNSFNDSLSVQHDDQTLFLRPMMASMYASQGNTDRQTAEQAAQYLWQRYTHSLAM